MGAKIRAIQYGLGPIGSAVARQAAQHGGIELVGAVDIDPAKVGCDIGDVIGLDHKLGVAVAGTLGDVLARASADLVFHTTSSYFDYFKPQVLEILAAGLDIVSTAEELSFPWLANHSDAAEIDVLARTMGKTILATGVNPGFLMDALPLSLTSICLKVDRIQVTRIINASTRRGPFQAKIGSGLAVDEFNQRMAAGRMGHVGMPQSMGMVFQTLGRQLIRYTDEVQPVVATRPVTTQHFAVEPGKVIGLKQVAHGYTAAGEFMTLTFVAALDAENEGDTIVIDGNPHLEVKLTGTNGDIATVAMVINAAPRVRAAGPGLMTMRDLPIMTNW